MKRQKKSGSNHKNHQKNKPPNNEIDKQEVHSCDQTSYKVKQSEVLGRYLVASKNIKPGENILTDEPLVVGPCQEAKPLCIGCYMNINLKNPQTYHRCTNCSWPMCSSNCSGYHKKHGHSKEECELLTESLIKDKEISSFGDFYYALAPFRCLVLKKTNPECWKVLEGMEPHTKERKRETKLWESNKKMGVDVIRDLWGLLDFTEEEIHFVCGILEVNAFEVNLVPPGAQCLRAVYPTAFLFAHDCVPNTCRSNGENFQLIVRATRAVPEDEMITISYAYTLQSTWKRRRHLQKTKFFSCCCQRCSDPTELGTYTGAMKCSVCKNGLLLPQKPLDDNSTWKCTSAKCSNEIQVSHIIPILDKLFIELDSIEGNDIISYENFIRKCNTIFHDNHYLSLSAMHCLSQLYGKISGYLINDLSEEQLERKEEICRKLVKIFDKLEPGLSKQRGILLYELQAPLMVMLTKKFQTQNIPKKEIKSKIKEVLKYLEESFLILSKEHKDSPEGQMAEAAQQGISSLRDWLHFLN